MHVNQNAFQFPGREPGFAYPTPGSVRGRVLAALLRGDSLTQADALRRWATSRLSSAIFQLRSEFNWPILTIEIDVETADCGRLATVARYMLPSHAILRAGARGQQFADEAAGEPPRTPDVGATGNSVCAGTPITAGCRS